MRALRIAGIWAAVIGVLTAAVVVLLTEILSLLAAALGGIVRVQPRVSDSATRR